MTVRGTGRPALAREEDDAARPASLDTITARRPSPTPLGKSATQEKLDWLDAVAADHARVNPTTFKVAFAVAQHLNNRTREAWPSQDRLAKLVGVSETTLRSSLKTLTGLGHLKQGKRGVRNANKYRLGRASGGTDEA